MSNSILARFNDDKRPSNFRCGVLLKDVEQLVVNSILG